MSALESLAAWAAETSDGHGDLAYARAGAAVTDTLACMIAGARDPATAAVRDAVAGWGGTTRGRGWTARAADFRTLGTSERVAPVSAEVGARRFHRAAVVVKSVILEAIAARWTQRLGRS